jgi:hypothetical protein
LLFIGHVWSTCLHAHIRSPVQVHVDVALVLQKELEKNQKIIQVVIGFYRYIVEKKME